MTHQSPKGAHWWKEAVVYQIYPSSFLDSNGDGLGDIPGIISKVDYIASLGVDAVWVSPFFKSPQVDMGYDISDYRDVHEPYGTVQDIEKLIAELGKHGIKFLMDLVVNHTSNEHPWFLESKSSKDNPKRDWYIWKKGKNGPNGEKLPPNNWESLFKGSAWEYDEITDEWYFHIFAIAQPDLNWENPDVRKQIYDDMHFWLKKGLGGLRIDAINLISKPDDLTDAPITHPGYHQSCFEMVKNRDRCHEFIQEMIREVVDKYDDLMTVGECGGTHEISDVKKYVQPERKEFNMIFQFELMDVDTGPLGVFSGKDWQLEDVKRLTHKWQNVLRPAWNTVHIENHDGGRSINRFGRTKHPQHLPAVSKMLAYYMMTIGGTLFLHQGQEIGAQSLTEDVGLHEYKDLATHSDYQKHKELRTLQAGHDDVDMSDVMQQILLKARDHSRVPMAWNGSVKDNAGFTTPDATPWMTLGTTFKHINVAAQESDPESPLNVWRKMIKFRKDNPAELVYGTYELVDATNPNIFAYERKSSPHSEHGHDDGKKTLLIALNWGDQPCAWSVPDGMINRKLMTNIGKFEDEAGKITFEPYACACWEVLETLEVPNNQPPQAE